MQVHKLDWLNAVPFDSDCKRPLDAVYGNDQTLVVIDGGEDSTNTVQASAPDSDLLANVEKRMLRKGDLFSDNQNFSDNRIPK